MTSFKTSAVSAKQCLKMKTRGFIALEQRDVLSVLPSDKLLACFTHFTAVDLKLVFSLYVH